MERIIRYNLTMEDNSKFTHDTYGNPKKYIESIVKPRRYIAYVTGPFGLKELKEACISQLSQHRQLDHMYMPLLDKENMPMPDLKVDKNTLVVGPDKISLVNAKTGIVHRSEDIIDQKNYKAIADIIITMCCPKFAIVADYDSDIYED